MHLLEKDEVGAILTSDGLISGVSDFRQLKIKQIKIKTKIGCLTTGE